jgi:hypothetical protein
MALTPVLCRLVPLIGPAVRQRDDANFVYLSTLEENINLDRRDVRDPITSAAPRHLPPLSLDVPQTHAADEVYRMAAQDNHQSRQFPFIHQDVEFFPAYPEK